MPDRQLGALMCSRHMIAPGPIRGFSDVYVIRTQQYELAWLNLYLCNAARRVADIPGRRTKIADIETTAPMTDEDSSIATASCTASPETSGRLLHALAFSRQAHCLRMAMKALFPAASLSFLAYQRNKPLKAWILPWQLDLGMPRRTAVSRRTGKLVCWSLDLRVKISGTVD